MYTGTYTCTLEYVLDRVIPWDCIIAIPVPTTLGIVFEYILHWNGSRGVRPSQYNVHVIQDMYLVPGSILQ